MHARVVRGVGLLRILSKVFHQPIDTVFGRTQKVDHRHCKLLTHAGDAIQHFPTHRNRTNDYSLDEVTSQGESDRTENAGIHQFGEAHCTAQHFGRPSIHQQQQELAFAFQA